MLEGFPVSCEGNINTNKFPKYVLRNTRLEWLQLVSLIGVVPSSNLGS
jgi:hypothetical protein